MKPLREALTNTPVHADYSGTVPILIIKRPDMFSFRNPGTMRVPVEDAFHGGNSDCRNRNLQTMFDLIGYGERVGSGLPKIFQNWKEQLWRLPELCENTKGRGLLYDFAIHLALMLIYIRVKRLKHEATTIEEILVACWLDIARLRRVPPTAGLVRELWVRSPNGTWRFFIIHDDLLVEIPPESLLDNSGVRPIKENAPGPNRSIVSATFPIHREGFVCPFTVPSPVSPE